MAPRIENLETKLRTEPIPPPPGYEWHDMSPEYDYEKKLAEARAEHARRANDKPPMAPAPKDTPREPDRGEDTPVDGGGFRWWLLSLFVGALQHKRLKTIRFTDRPISGLGPYRTLPVWD